MRCIAFHVGMNLVMLLAFLAWAFYKVKWQSEPSDDLYLSPEQLDVFRRRHGDR